MIDETGCAGVSIGRGAFYHPWIFRHTGHYLRTGEELPEPGFAERVRVMRRHLERMIEVYGELHACRMFRKVAPWYARQFGPAKLFNRRVVRFRRKRSSSRCWRTTSWRQQFLDEGGELLHVSTWPAGRAVRANPSLCLRTSLFRGPGKWVVRTRRGSRSGRSHWRKGDGAVEARLYG
jgi:hypothetical protein